MSACLAAVVLACSGMASAHGGARVQPGAGTRDAAHAHPEPRGDSHGHAASSSAAPTTNDLLVLGTRALVEHRFAEALAHGSAALADAGAGANEAHALAVVTDACVELGRYDDAVGYAQRLVDRYPGLAAHARVSYLRELHGDAAGARNAMRDAAGAGRDGDEVAWCRVRVAELELLLGDLGAAEREANLALALAPRCAEAVALLGRVRAARGEWPEAIARYRTALEMRADSGFFIALGEALEASGDTPGALDAFESARSVLEEDAAAGTDVELELIALDLDLLDKPERSTAGEDDVHVGITRAEGHLVERALALRDRRPTIFADALLAEVLARAGRIDEAIAAVERCLRLRCGNPVLLYRAAIARRVAGDSAGTAPLLRAALAAAPALGARHAAAASRLLAEIAETP
ncbi:MAG: tetratricopeptide repeat protein [bacterium]